MDPDVPPGSDKADAPPAVVPLHGEDLGPGGPVSGPQPTTAGNVGCLTTGHHSVG